MFDQIDRDQMPLRFTGTDSGVEPLTWGQKAILRDMRDSGSQFSMGGMIEFPEGSTVEDAALRFSGLLGRHAALRMRLASDPAGRPCQEVAGSGQTTLDILTVPDDASPAETARYVEELLATWPATRFDFQRDWPMRAAVVRHRRGYLSLVWVLSHLVADGGAHLLLLADLEAAGTAGRYAPPPRTQLLDLARHEREPQLRQLSRRAMRYWASQLRDIPAQTFGAPVPGEHPAAQRYQHVRFSSPAAHLAVLAIARRTGTDAARAALAVIAIAIARATGVTPLPVKVMVNNRFRPGLAEVIAPISQNAVITVDVSEVSIDEVVGRVRGAMLTAGMRAYYDPDELSELNAKLDAERGYPAAVTCRLNDQRRMVRGADEEADPGQASPEQIARLRAETTLTWLGPTDNTHEQIAVIIENRPDVLSLNLMWDRWSLTTEQIEASLRAVEEVAVAAAVDPAAPTGVPARSAANTSG